MKTMWLAVAFLVVSVLAVPAGWAQKYDDKEHAELAKALKDAKISLQRGLDAAANDAVKQNQGYRVVSVMPTLKDGHPIADVTLLKGADWKTVSEKLD
jgi:hypothetical protein